MKAASHDCSNGSSENNDTFSVARPSAADSLALLSDADSTNLKCQTCISVRLRVHIYNTNKGLSQAVPLACS